MNGHDLQAHWAWCIEPAMAHLDKVEAAAVIGSAEEPRYCVAMGAPFLAHCVDCITEAVTP